ncbi:MAG: hypothetical protein QOJ12_2459 [Thermoleophilales bacterium]|nr:hypothetical protein [Thermoleophilales bacterium]
MAAPLDETPSVLLVDDRRENLLALEAVLEPLEVRVRSAQSGQDALKALLDEDFAVVLLDVQMPGMDGFETAGYIRGRERSRTTPIIFLTAVSSDVAQVSKGYEAGAVDYVLKPFDPAILRSKVGVFCDLERQRRGRARSDELLDRAWAASPTGAALVDADGLLMRRNPALDRLCGGAVHDHAPADSIVEPGYRPAVRDLLASALAGEEPGVREVGLVARGEELPVSLLASGVRDADGEIRSVYLLVDDLRPRRRAEAARERLASEQAARARAEAAYERERSIASTLQRDLLPRRLPDAPGVSLAAHFSAGGEGTAVGGDWFDAFPLPGGRLGLIIGDVAGRGVAAAARMGQLRSVARAYAIEGHAPAEVLARLNLYHQALRADDMTTLVYAVVEPDLGRLRLVNAGHPPPALAVPGSAPRLLEGSCPALGIVEICAPPEIVVDFPPEATLALFTDGLVERRDEAIDCGLSRLLAALGAARGDVEEHREAVIAACVGPEAVDDDVTALFVRAETALGDQLRFTLTPDPSALAALRRMLRRWLAELGAEPDEIGGAVMAANEAWQNALEHGHGFAAVPVHVRFERDDDQIVIKVRDAGGRGQPASDPDRGRGIELMRGLMDEARLDLGTHRGGVVELRRRLRVLAGTGPGVRGDEAAA